MELRRIKWNQKFFNLANFCWRVFEENAKHVGSPVTYLCLVLLCDQNSFGRSKMVLFWPIDLDLTIRIWSRPKWNGHKQNELVRSKLWFFTKMNHIWTWPIHFGCDHFILVMTKSLWSSPNQFGQTKTILDRPKLFWSHRRTRHLSYHNFEIFWSIIWTSLVLLACAVSLNNANSHRNLVNYFIFFEQ